MLEPVIIGGGRIVAYNADCRDVLRQLVARGERVHAMHSDPPYHLTSIVKRFGGDMPPRTEATVGKHAFGRHARGFMGKTWDGGDIAFDPETWRLHLDALLPGGYLTAFASSRGFGRMSVAIEDAGFVTHPMLGWIFGSGMPKATRLKASDTDHLRYGGQALKPALEPIFCGSKPFEDCPELEENVNFQNKLEALLWFIASAKTAELVFKKNQVALDGSVRWIACVAAEMSSEDPKDLMDTFSSLEVGSTFLSIALLWSAICRENWQNTNTSITRMASKATTELKILSSWISAIIPESIMQEVTRQNGVWFTAQAAESLFGSCHASLTNIQKLSADENVTKNHAKKILQELASIAERNSLLPHATIDAIVRDPAQIKAEQNKTALEPIYMGQKPMEGTGTANWLQHGVGPLDIDAGRVDGGGNKTFDRHAGDRARDQYRFGTTGKAMPTDLGRWPANLVHDGSPEVLETFEAVGERSSRPGRTKVRGESRVCYGAATRDDGPRHQDTGSAARFFYESKASEGDRWFWCPACEIAGPARAMGAHQHGREDLSHLVSHPTVKPLALARWLVRLTCPQRGQTVFDGFAGTGTTGVACLAEGRQAILCERDPDYFRILVARCKHYAGESAFVLPGKVAKGKEPVALPLFGSAAE